MSPEQPTRRPSLFLAHWSLFAQFAAVLLVIGGVIVWWALDQVEDKVRAELVELGSAAGLQVSLDEVSASPLGDLTITRLEARRLDGSKALWVGAVHVGWQPLSLILGHRMPAELRLLRPAAELRLVDGRPAEVKRWLAAVRKRLGGSEASADKPSSHNGGWRGPDVIEVVGGVLRIQPTGKVGDVLPTGLLLADLNVDLRRDSGGKLSAHLVSPAESTLLGRGQSNERGALALTAAFSPPLRIPLHGRLSGGLVGFEVVISGLGWSAEHGPYMAGISVQRAGREQVRVARLGLETGEATKARADGVVLEVEPSLWGALLARPAIVPVVGGRLEIGTVRAHLRQGEEGSARLELQANGLMAVLPRGLGRGTISQITMVLPQPGTGTPDPGDVMVELRRPRLELQATGPTTPSALASAGALADRLGKEAALPLASVRPADARLESGWQRPGTVSVAERRATRRKQSKEERKVARLEKRRRRQERMERLRRSGAYTKRFVPPLRRARQTLVDLAGRIRALGGPGVVRTPQLRIEDGSVEVVGASGRLAVAGVDLSWLRADDGSASLQVSGQLRADKAKLGRWRLRADVTEALELGPVQLDLQGRELARIGRAFWPHLGIGQNPAIHLNMRLNVGASRAPLQIDGSWTSRDVGLDWRRFSPVPHTDFPVDATFAVRVGAGPWGAIRLDVPELRLGQAVMRVRATAGKLRREPYVDLRVELPKQDCGRVARSIPASMMPTIGAIRARGPVSWWVDLHVDLMHPYFSELDVALDDKHCQVDGFGRVDVAGLAEDFVRKVNEDGFILDSVRIGPASGSWTPLGHMPRWLPYAITTTEDGSFFSHRGLNPFLLNRAIRLDLHAGRFVYGGSTLTQQLVKNLFMTRSKYLGRKLEELLIVWHMERTLGKARILEIYANAVEFGPGQYGVTRGARHYFDKPPTRVSPLEAAWLGSIKPCPACADGHFRARRYGIWYQRRLLEILTRMEYFGVISKEAYEREMNTVPRFTGWPPGKLAQRFNLPIPPRKLNRADLGRRAAEVDEETLQQEAADRREKMRKRILERETRLRKAAADRDARRIRFETERQEVLQKRVRKLEAKRSGKMTARQHRLLARSKRLAATIKKRKKALVAAKRRNEEHSWEERQRMAIEAEKRRRQAAEKAAKKRKSGGKLDR